MSKPMDHADCTDDREAFEKRLADLGPEAVRTMFGQGMFPTTSNTVILEWLKGQAK